MAKKKKVVAKKRKVVAAPKRIRRSKEQIKKDELQAPYLKQYKKEGKSAAFIHSWKTGWDRESVTE